ncbi:MAG: hypothetical protein ACYC1M_13885 [Armatimonadota bacterium]
MRKYFIATMLVLASCAYAQQPQSAPQTAAPATETKATPVVDGKPIAAVLTAWAKLNEKTLVLEPGMVASVKLDPAAKTFEQGLDLALKPYENILWRKVFMRAKMEQPKPERLAAMVRTMVALEATGLIVQDPTASKISSFVKSVDVPQNYATALDKMSPAFNAKAVYVVFDNKPSWASANGVSLLDLTADPSSIPEGTLNAENVKQITEKLLSAMASMSSEERAKAIRGMMNMGANIDSRTRVAMFLDGVKVMSSMTPEEIENMKQRSIAQHNEDLQTLKDMGIQIPGMTPPGQ